MSVQTTRDFIEESRALLGDTACDIPRALFIAAINQALRRLAREPGLDKLFKFHSTFDLKSIDTNGKPATQWDLSKNAKGEQLGMIIDIKSLRLLDNSQCSILNTNACYKELDEFLEDNVHPESCPAGTADEYTLNQIQGRTLLMLDRPTNSPRMVDMYYTAFHPRIRDESDDLLTPYEYNDILAEMVKIYYNMESADFASARALYEDVDVMVDTARELLARRPRGLPFRRMNGSF